MQTKEDLHHVLKQITCFMLLAFKEYIAGCFCIPQVSEQLVGWGEELLQKTLEHYVEFMI